MSPRRTLCIGVVAIVLIALAAHAAHAGPGSSHSHAAPSRHGGLVEAVGDRYLELTLYFMGAREPVAAPVEDRPIMVRIEPHLKDGLTGPFELELRPIPQEDDPRGLSSRFIGRDAELVGLDRFEASLRSAIAGELHDVSYAVNSVSMRQRFTCPMRCESGATFATAGSCPVCKMPLRSTRDAHGDHDPKHGGVLFMAPDGWHHLEGVLHSPYEFRLYLYDDFTQPISAAPFERGSWIEVSSRHARTQSPIRLELSMSAESDCLEARIPDEVTGPLEVELRLRFAGRDEPELFNFSFDDQADGWRQD
jgi:hypothetical protein